MLWKVIKREDLLRHREADPPHANPDWAEKAYHHVIWSTIPSPAINLEVTDQCPTRPEWFARPQLNPDDDRHTKRPTPPTRFASTLLIDRLVTVPWSRLCFIFWRYKEKLNLPTSRHPHRRRCRHSVVTVPLIPGLSTVSAQVRNMLLV
nr:hypothetical protein CFP56_13463 [Quercus suber]